VWTSLVTYALIFVGFPLIGLLAFYWVRNGF